MQDLFQFVSFMQVHKNCFAVNIRSNINAQKQQIHSNVLTGHKHLRVRKSGEMVDSWGDHVMSELLRWIEFQGKEGEGLVTMQSARLLL